MAKQFAFIKMKCYKICHGPDRLPPQTQRPDHGQSPVSRRWGFFFWCGSRDARGEPPGVRGTVARPIAQGRATLATPRGHRSLGLAQIVACVAIGICLGQVAGSFDSLAPATAPPALTKMPCRWHCERQRQDGGIHRPAAGNALHSLVSSLPTGPPFLRSGTQQL
jgi:hypothetical protein